MKSADDKEARFSEATTPKMRPRLFLMEQEEHSCADMTLVGSPECGQTVLTSADAGAGEYAVLSAREVAFDDVHDFDRWAGAVRVAICGLLPLADEVAP